MEHNPINISKASTPFDDASADVILRTSDNVDFHVFRVVLSLASPFFKDLFSLKQPSKLPTSSDATDALPIITVSESARTFDYLLRICYPIADPVITDVAAIGNVLEAAVKYEMEQPTLLMKKALRDGISTDPLEVFTAACRLNLEEDAMLAAQSFRDSILGVLFGGHMPDIWEYTVASRAYVPSMSAISAGQFSRLLRFLRGAGFAGTFKFCEPEPEGFVPPFPDDASSVRSAPNPPESTFTQPNHDLTIRTSNNVNLHVHTLILSLASPVLKKLISVQSGTSPLVLSLDEPASVLVPLMQLCYPIDEPEITDSQTAAVLLAAASKYQMPRAISYIQRSLRSCVDVDPLRMFFTAVRHGWTSEAEYFASRLIHTVIEDVYVPEMEYIPANVYYALLKYHFECRKRIERITYRVAGAMPQLRPFENRPLPRRGIFRESSEMIFVPIIERAVTREWRTRNFDVRPLITESRNLEMEIEEALSNVKLEIPSA